VPRPTRQQIDDEIVEQASALFARHGFKDTSLQSVADAAGYSKTGLLHRFPSKEALWAAVVERCVRLCRQVADSVADLPVGPERDRAVLTGLVDLTFGHPGAVALVLSVFSTTDRVDLREIGDTILGAFGADARPERATERAAERATERHVRVLGALGAVAVAGIALRDSGATHDDVREHLVAAAYDTLGHAPHPQIPAARRAPAPVKD
jgi:AcrR family transcriptional regulator